MEKTPTPHRNAYLLAGFVISNLVICFLGAFIFPAFWSLGIDSDISIVFIGTIFFVTFSSSIASYYWSLGGISLRTIRTLAIPNGSWVWFLYVMHPEFGKDIFLIIFSAVIVLFCAPLGTWFGRRFFYE